MVGVGSGEFALRERVGGASCAKVRGSASGLACGSFVSKIVETSSDYCLIEWMAVGSGDSSGAIIANLTTLTYRSS
jgi:hypothetical protein